jgi:hypothetical protein
VRVKIDAHDVASWPDNARHVTRDMAAAASSIQTVIAGLQPRAVEKLKRRGSHGVGEQVEPLLALFPTRDCVSSDDRLATS